MGTLSYTEEYFFNSRHSYDRAKERAGLNRKRAEKMIGLARDRGIEYEDCSWSLDKRFLQMRTDDRTKAVAFNGFCFIFDRETLKCVTLYPLPKSFGKKKTFFYREKRDEMYERAYIRECVGL